MAAPVVSVASNLPTEAPASALTYLSALDGPDAVYLWVAHGSGKGAPFQRWGTLATAWPWLRGMNAAGRSIYVALNSHLPGPWTGPVEDTPVLVKGPQGSTVPATYGQVRGQQHMAIRTATAMKRARVLKLDIDEGGATFLERLAASTLPPPTVLVETSPHRYQALWALQPHAQADDPRLRAAERRMARLFGGDAAVTDPARVFRLPGTYNPKHTGAPLATLVEARPTTWSLDAACAVLGVSADEAVPAHSPSPATPPPPRWTEEQVLWRDKMWAKCIRAQLRPLEFHVGKALEAIKRAVFLAADWGFSEEELDTPACLGPWLASAVIHPPKEGESPNPDAQDPAGCVRRLYRSCLSSRAEAVGYRITEEWFRRGLTDGLFPENYPPDARPDATSDAPPDGTPPSGGAPTAPQAPAPANLPALSPQGVALHFCAREGTPPGQPPVTDEVTGEVHLFDVATGIYRHVPKDTLERQVVTRYDGAPAFDRNNPGRSVVIEWKSQRLVEDTLKAIQRVASGQQHGPRGGVGFADGHAITVDPVSGGLVARKAAPAERLGVGMHHYPFEFIEGAVPSGFLRWLSSCFLDDDRAAKVLLIRQWMGAVILGAARRTATAVVLQGKPQTGKSVLLNILRMVVPDLWGMVSPAELGEEYTRARLATSRLLVMPDNVDAAGFRYLKSIISDDPPLSARDPYGRKHQVSPQCGVVLASNGRLVINEDPGDGIWRRLAPVVFTRPPVPDASKRDIAAELAPELPQIVSWAIEGARALADTGWTLPEVPSVTEERAAWQRHGNSFMDWLATQTDFHPGQAAADATPVTFGDLYEAYGFDCNRYGVQHKMGLARAFGCFRYLHAVNPPEDMRRGVAVGWARAATGATSTTPLAAALVARGVRRPPPAAVPDHVLGEVADAWHWDARVREVWAQLADPATLPPELVDVRALAQDTGASVEAVLRCLRTELDMEPVTVPLSPRVPGIRRMGALHAAPGRAQP